MPEHHGKLDKQLFLERLKKLIADTGKTCKELDEYVWGFENYGISPLSNHPTLEQAMIFADYFNVSTDYLLGRDNYWQDAEGHITARMPSDIFTDEEKQQILKRLEERNK